ncbi:MAG TPA: hypothetical protein VFV38_08755 [Ktedonobacteraceae bacterium]|nr:hypothetical protein [Ktedonobacteraceae bacterium]
MTTRPYEQGAYDLSQAVESTRRLGIPRDQVLNHYLGAEGHGIQGALNAACNTYGNDAPADIKASYVLGWVAALLHQKLNP